MSQFDQAYHYLPDLFEVHGRFFPARPAVVCGAELRNWGDLNLAFSRVANSLIALGIARGERVAVVMGNQVRTVEVMFGVVKAGACVVPISQMLTSDQIAGLIRDSGARVVIACPGGRALLDPVRATFAAQLCAGGLIGSGFEAEGWSSFDTMIARAGAGEPLVRLEQNDPLNIIYSSGTTGLPKGIVQSHRARYHFAYSNAHEMEYTRDCRALTTTPLYSNGTWLTMLPALFAGGCVHVLEKFEPGAFLDTVERERITHTFMVPTQFAALLERGDLEKRDLSSLRVMLSAGSAMRPDIKKAVLARIGKGLYELYGATEGVATMLKPAQQMERPASVGTPVMGFDVRIISDEGQELPRGETGEIVGYGPGLMTAYHNRPDATAESVWRDARGRSFFRTGDIGRFDNDGFLYILDRKKDMILSGGFNIFPADIEQILATHPAVQEVAVIAAPHPKWGETPLALVVRRAGTDDSAEAIRDWANERLAKTQRVSAVEFRADLPRNALGKVLKRVLREPFWQDQGAKS